MKARLLLLGCGNVGGEFARLLLARRAGILSRWGVDLDLVGIVRKHATAPLVGISASVYDNFQAALMKTKPDIVIELVGGVDPVADYIQKALANGAHVVTANKAVLAAKGRVLQQAAAKAQRLLLAEASVGGAIPLLRTLHTSLAGDSIRRIIGVWNGTCNYILTRMEREKIPFADVLADAQRLGYAEPDPSLDVSGADTAHKATVLAQLAFGVYEPIADADFRGISEFQAPDFREASDWGLRPKMIGLLARQNAGIIRYVGPALLPMAHPVATLESVNNGIFIEAETAGAVFLSGPGAGASPTAATVLGDVIEAARALKQNDVSANRWGNALLQEPSVIPYRQAEFPCFIRVRVQDQPGVLAKLASILAEQKISIGSVYQPKVAGTSVALYLMTHRAAIANVQAALAVWASLDFVEEQPFWLPILEQQG